jgi:hypothetical protein
MHGWMLYHMWVPIAAWKSLTKSMGQIDDRLGNIPRRINTLTMLSSNWPTTCTSLKAMAAM